MLFLFSCWFLVGRVDTVFRWFTRFNLNLANRMVSRKGLNLRHDELVFFIFFHPAAFSSFFSAIDSNAWVAISTVCEKRLTCLLRKGEKYVAMKVTTKCQTSDHISFVVNIVKLVGDPCKQTSSLFPGQWFFNYSPKLAICLKLYMWMRSSCN